MDEPTIQSLIHQIRSRLQGELTIPENFTATQIARRAQNFYDDINEVMRELRIYGRKHPAVIALCTDLAMHFISCSDRAFALNKNDTTTNDALVGLATSSLMGIEHDLQAMLQEKGQRNHWHGW